MFTVKSPAKLFKDPLLQTAEVESTSFTVKVKDKYVKHETAIKL